MTRTYFTLLIDSEKNFENEEAAIMKYFEIDNKVLSNDFSMGTNRKSEFLLDIERNVVDMIFFNDMSDEEVSFWENKLLEFVKKYFSKEKILFKKVSDMHGSQFRLLNS